jgi:hypothetical protein
MHLPPRQHHLDRHDAGQANANMRERLWWQPLREWPPGMCFTDGRTERVIERSPLPLPDAAGMYGCAADMCEAPRFAEPEIDSDLSS